MENTITPTRRLLRLRVPLTCLIAFCLYYSSVAAQGVVAYEHSNFTGRSRPLPVGSHRFYSSVEFNDIISSIKVPVGFGVILFEHADNVGGYGISVDLLEDCPDLVKYNFNDKVSYITVFSIPSGISCWWVRNNRVNGQFIEGHWENSEMIFVRPTAATVSPSIPPNTPEKIIITNSEPDPAAALISALAKPNRTVYGKPVPIVVEFCRDIDLTEHTILIGPDRSLVASPSCARGPRSQGPRIYIRENRRADKPLFEIRGDNVLFSGFRLEGPSAGSRQGDDNLEKAIMIWPYECVQKVCDCPAEPIRNIEISNMEIAYWSGAGVTINDNTVQAERGRMFNTNEGGVRIRNNYIHHNLHGSGNGYGVNVGGGSYVLIEQNVFDANRHAIAGGSSDLKKDFSGYTARDNLFLAGGGEHCPESFLLPCWQTHQIDMHGDGNEFYSSSNWQCGTAGETMIIQRNTILYTGGLAIKIRGNPADKVVVDNNVFAHGNQKSAIDQKGNCGIGGDVTRPLDIRANNIYSAKPLSSVGKIDLVGDGILEELMTTGVTWWAKSTVTNQWRYLNTMPETLRKLVFGDYDNDGKADDIAFAPPQMTVAPRKYTKDGKGAWIPLTPVTR